MPELFKNKEKQDHTYKTGEQNIQKTGTTILSKKPVENTRVYGRESLKVPVPKEATDKSFTGAVKKFFRIKDDLLGDENDVRIHNEHVEEGPARRAYIDLTDEERESETERASQAEWDSIGKQMDEIMASRLYAGYSENTKKLIEDIKSNSAKGVSTLTRAVFRGNKINKLKDIAREVESIKSIDGPDKEAVEEAKRARMEDLKEKYPDLEVLMMIHTVLNAGVKGNLDNTEEGTLVEQLDDHYFEKEERLKGVRGVNCTYDRRVVTFDDKDCNLSFVPLFASEPSITDLQQGAIADCYFITALSSIVEKNPDYIKDCMKDEGNTVLVRFFSPITFKPVYVRVNKTVPVDIYCGKNQAGEDVRRKVSFYGAKGGALWVNMMEKAFAVVRSRIDPLSPDFHKSAFGLGKKGYDALFHGKSSSLLRILTGKQIVKKSLPGGSDDRKYTDISTLFSHVHYGEKDAFMRGKKEGNANRTSADWNRHKAKQIFGIDIPEGNNDLLEAFRKNRLFKAYEDYLSKYLKDNFESDDRKPSFRTMTDLNLFLDSIDISQMPVLNLGNGLDEDQIKRHYIEYFRKSIAASGLLINGINVNGKYSQKEKEIWKQLNKDLTDKNGNKKAVTAAIERFDLYFKNGKAKQGNAGETVLQGLADRHDYSVLGTTIRDRIIDGKTVKQRFVIVRNPWRDERIRLYDQDTMRPYTNTAVNKADGSDYIAKGTFLMEFSDFCNTFKYYTAEAPEKKDELTQKEKELEEKANTRTVGDMREKYTTAFDLTDEERVLQSVRDRDKELEHIAEMAEVIKNSPEYESITEKSKLMLNTIVQYSAKDKSAEERARLLSEVLSDLRAIINGVTAKKGEKESEIKNKREDVERRYGNPDILSGLAITLLSMSDGSLRLNGSEEIINATDDTVFETSEDIKEKDLKKTSDGKIKKHEQVFFDRVAGDRTRSPLFAVMPSAEDVAQGNIGDCYMLSGLNAILEKDPEFIKSAMKDEGDTVVVRFYNYNSGKPVYVRVRKTVATSRYTGTQYGEEYSEELHKGAKRALWVNILEKAFVIAREKLDDPSYKKEEARKGFRKIHTGRPSAFIKMFTGRECEVTKLGTMQKRTFGTFGLLAEHVRGIGKDAFLQGKNADGSGRTSRDYYLYKAKTVFGIDIPSKDDALYKLFEDNTVFEGYEKFMEKYLKENFISGGLKSAAFYSVQDLDMFLDSIDINKMPTFGIRSGIDEDELKKNYIEYFRKTIAASNLLHNNVCMDGEYNDTEKKLYQDILNAKKDKRMVTALVNNVPLLKNSKEAVKESGESVVTGLATGHAYSIHGVTQKEVAIGGKTVTQCFVIVKNPWNENVIRNYDRDTMKPFLKSEEDRKAADYDAKGLFLVELRDFYNSFMSLDIEKKK